MDQWHLLCVWWLRINISYLKIWDMPWDMRFEIQDLRYALRYISWDMPWDTRFKIQHLRYALRQKIQDTRFEIQDTPWDTRFRYNIWDTRLEIHLEIHILRYKIQDLKYVSHISRYEIWDTSWDTRFEICLEIHILRFEDLRYTLYKVLKWGWFR